jgi:hypothetical protein
MCGSWGLRLGGTETRKRNQDKWAIGEVKSFSAIDFRGFEEDEQTSTSLFLPAFVLFLPVANPNLSEYSPGKRHRFDHNKKDAACRPGFPAPPQLRDVRFSSRSIVSQEACRDKETHRRISSFRQILSKS